MSGVLTEREWLDWRIRQRRSNAPSWGAQYLTGTPHGHPIKRDRGFLVFMLMLALMIAVAIPFLAPSGQEAYAIYTACPQTPSLRAVRTVSDIGYFIPDTISLSRKIFTREELLRGKLLVLSEDDPIPNDVPAPCTFSVAKQGKGMVPVSDFNIQSGKETIAALTRLFYGMRARGSEGLIVWRGTVNAAAQRQMLIDTLRSRVVSMSLNAAVQHTLSDMDLPGYGELTQEYAIEVRLNTGGRDPDSRALISTDQGRELVRCAWIYGFICCDKPSTDAASIRLRYVGEAHATAMKYLNLDLTSYLEHLHRKRVITVQSNGAVRYLICCEPLTDTHVAFFVPNGASIEISADNMGYAIAACTLP